MAFNFGAKPNPKLIIPPPKYHTERKAAPAPAKPLPSHTKYAARPSKSSADIPRKSTTKSHLKSSSAPRISAATLAPPILKRKASRQASPVKLGVQFDSDSDDDDFGSPASTEFTVDKRVRRSLVPEEGYSRNAFKAFREGSFKMLHAADIKYPIRKSKLLASVSAETKAQENIVLEVQYPGAAQRERFVLVFTKDQINPAQEIYDIAKIVANVYVTGTAAERFLEPQGGILRKLERAMNQLCKDRHTKADKVLLNAFKASVENYNMELDLMIKAGDLARNMDTNRVSEEMAFFIVKQAYHRVVSPRVDSIHAKVDDKDNTYGELEPPFVSRVISETKLKEDQVFIDLGSGVGNIVLQMALEVGCESWGCEMREVSCAAAEDQKTEFAARCRLWGLRAGRVHFERGDFRENVPIREVMKKADVILVNNEVFGSDLNQYLRDAFLDLKDGCRVVSLKSFGPSNDKRNENDTFSHFVIKEKEYSAGDVSWKGQGGTYFIATKDPKAVQRLMAKRTR